MTFIPHQHDYFIILPLFFLGIIVSIGLLFYQCFTTWVIVDSTWNLNCPSCPSISSKDFWAQVVPLTIKVPSYILVLAIALSVISVILISYSWIVLYWASFSMENIRRRRIFHKDVGIILWITLLFGFVGFIIITNIYLSMPFDKRSHMDEIFIGWVCTIY